MKRKLRNKPTAGIAIATGNKVTKGTITSMCFTFVTLLLIFMACTNTHEAHDRASFTCPMHPTVVSDEPGTCPVCGMDLVRKTRPDEEIAITEGLSKLLRSPNESVVAAVETVKGQYKAVPLSVQAQGVVTYDTRNIYTIPARVGGRLEKVSLNYTFQQLSKGQKVAEIYSPQLITAQRELLFLLENDPENAALIDAAGQKLELLGMTQGEIKKLIKRKEATSTFSVYSPYSGYVITAQQTPPTSVDGSSGNRRGGMASATNAMATTQDVSNANGSMLREGDYVTPGQTLFTVVNAKALRIELNLPGSYNGLIKEGSSVQLDFGNNIKEVATVDFIQPFFGDGREFMTIRVYMNETEGLHIGHLVSGTITLESREALWVPKEAVLDLGVRKVVFVKDRGSFKPKEVTTGAGADQMIEIKSGLASSEDIAANAHFLVDSESFIKAEN